MSNLDREIGSNVEDDPNANGIAADTTTPRSDEVHPVEERPASEQPIGISTSPTAAGNRPQDDEVEEEEDTK